MKPQTSIKLKKKEWFNIYGDSTVVVILTGIGYFLIREPAGKELVFSVLIFSALLLFSFWLSWYQECFQECEINLTERQFKRAVHATAIELDWQITQLNKSYAQANRFPEPLGSGGELIIIKKIESKISIKSTAHDNMSYLYEDGHHPSYSPKRNLENVNSFLTNIEHILQGRNVEKIVEEKTRKKEEDFWNESEWTIGKILMRTTGYGVIAIFLVIGILLVQTDIVEGIFFLILSMLMMRIYIGSDVKIIQEKRKRDRL